MMSGDGQLQVNETMKEKSQAERREMAAAAKARGKAMKFLNFDKYDSGSLNRSNDEVYTRLTESYLQFRIMHYTKPHLPTIEYILR